MSEYKGRCACGAVSYEIDRTPLIVHACHCSDCQRLTGSAFAINLVFEAKAVTTTSGAPSYVQNLLQIALTMLPSGFPGMVGAETSTIAAPAVPSRRQAAFFICSR
ncbi:MAG: GFA family protein, partial [Alphaproteobacteria bacterium]|nr:GFA family protein [Alphaproteobacteria bacterium]